MELIHAKEAVRTGEKRLEEQAKSLTTLETRAMSIATWSVAAMTASLNFLFGQYQIESKIIAITILPFLILTVYCGARVLVPGSWKMPGRNSLDLISRDPKETEIEFYTFLAKDYGRGIIRNTTRLQAAADSILLAMKSIAIGMLLVLAMLVLHYQRS